ncbi:MAG: tyrosine-type recombinase/integrase [Gammaproteobacteria bacterium]|nr:tyrosine-type recombinase/integrase [Gammaproteobacteria bacterium]
MNEKDIKSLRWEKDKRLGLGDGLYLNLRKSSKTYIIRKQISGKTQIITLGKSPALSLRKARLKAAEYLVKRDVSTSTVKELVEKYYSEIVIPTSKVPNQVIGYLNNIEAEFGHKKNIDVTRSMLVRFIQIYSKERGARSADRIRSYLKQVFSYAVELGWLDSSPMSEVTKRITGYQSIERSRVLSPDEIKMIWNWKNNSIGWQKTEDNCRVIKFLLLTGLRISEAQKGYQDGDKFRIDDTKGRHGKHETRPHWVHLTDTAKGLLPLPHCTATNIQAWLRRKLGNEGYKEKESRFTPHDCRRTFATMANDKGVMPHVVEKCLNHKMEGMMAVYNHAEYEQERIEAAEIVEKTILEVIK